METGTNKTALRIQLAGIVLCLYFAFILAAGAMFLGEHFVPDFFWITLVYGAILCPIDMYLARKTQKYMYRRIHRLVFAEEEVTLAPGDLTKAKRAVLTIPWVAATRDFLAWTVSNVIYCFVLCPLYVHFQGVHAHFPTDPVFWSKAFVLLSFPLAPLVMIAGLLTYSAATIFYVHFFFRQAEYEQFILALTPIRRRYMYFALFGYTFLLVIGALDYNFATKQFATIHQFVESARHTELAGVCLLIGVGSILVLLAKMEGRAKRKLPMQLEVIKKQSPPVDKRCPKCQLTVGPGMDVCPRDDTPLTTFPDQDAASFNTSYEFLEEIARGGMSVIFKARHRVTRRFVAIKELDTRLASVSASVERFIAEARTASSLNHPNVVTVHEFGQFESQKLFIIMEFIDGCTLSRLVSDHHGGLPVRDCLQIFDQICDAMSYAHERKILHRDLKPSNIMVTMHDGQFQKYAIKIVDFGIAKMLEGTAGNLTNTGDVFGTPDYMSPEQCLGMRLDARSDIYSMGCLMYECLTGVKPAEGENPLATMYKQINEQPKPVSEIRAELSSMPGLEAVLMKAMSKQPEHRYATFNDLRGALHAVASQISRSSLVRES